MNRRDAPTATRMTNILDGSGSGDLVPETNRRRRCSELTEGS
jgi:hypothetical protein